MTTKHSVNVTPLDYVNLRRLHNELGNGNDDLWVATLKRVLTASSKAHGGTVTEDTDLWGTEVELTIIRSKNAPTHLLIDHAKS